MSVRVLDLFSGIGGFSLGLEKCGFKTVAFCEIEEYPRKVLRRHWPDAPIYNDIKKLTKEKLLKDGINDIGLISGGYPCQGESLAGLRFGKKDNRYLWPEMYRLVKAIRPRWVIAENVAGHISLGLDQVLSDMEAEDYTCWPFVIPACAVDAPTDATECGLWPTPNTKGYRSDGELAMLAKKLTDRDEFLAMTHRAANSKRKRFYPTPTVSGNHNRKGLSKSSGDGLATVVKRMYPTPLARCHTAPSRSENKQGTDNLQTLVGGALNPMWVEWLMGFPMSWTATETYPSNPRRKIRRPAGTTALKR